MEQTRIVPIYMSGWCIQIRKGHIVFARSVLWMMQSMTQATYPILQLMHQPRCTSLTVLEHGTLGLRSSR